MMQFFIRSSRFISNGNLNILIFVRIYVKISKIQTQVSVTFCEKSILFPSKITSIICFTIFTIFTIFYEIPSSTNLRKFENRKTF
jgi:hypothetical protein